MDNMVDEGDEEIETSGVWKEILGSQKISGTKKLMKKGSLDVLYTHDPEVVQKQRQIQTIINNVHTKNGWVSIQQ